MKIIKMNSDNTINILNPEKFYVARIEWIGREASEVDYWNCIYCSGEYSFYLHKVSYNDINEMAWSHKELQKCIEQCLSDFNTAIRETRYVGTLYQFNNESEFLESHQAGLL